jgi:hypothetical protein
MDATNLVTELIKAGIPSLQLGISNASVGQMPVIWFRVFEVPGLALKLGITRDGIWGRETQAGVALAKPGAPFFLPILEVPFARFKRSLEDQLAGMGVDRALIQCFPFEDTVSTAITSHSEKWQALGLRWIEEMPISEKIRDALDKAKHTAVTQRLRHRAESLLRRTRS